MSRKATVVATFFDRALDAAVFSAELERIREAIIALINEQTK